MHSPEFVAVQAAYRAQLVGAILGILREFAAEGVDGLTVAADVQKDGEVDIDLAFSASGMPVHGQSL